MGQSLIKKHSKIQTFDDIYCGMMTRLRNTRLGTFIQCQYTRSLFKKHSKFQDRNTLLWDGQTQEHEFGCFYTMSVHKNYFKKEKYGTESH